MMAHFGSYDTSNPQTGQAPLGGNVTVILGPMQTDHAQIIAGSVFADQPGTLYVEQSFDGTNFDVSWSSAITASAGVGFNETLLAPIVQVRYVNGATAQGVLRLFARTFVQGR